MFKINNKNTRTTPVTSDAALKFVATILFLDVKMDAFFVCVTVWKTEIHLQLYLITDAVTSRKFFVSFRAPIMNNMSDTHFQNPVCMFTIF